MLFHVPLFYKQLQGIFNFSQFYQSLFLLKKRVKKTSKKPYLK
jgi:hypothetical protein